MTELLDAFRLIAQNKHEKHEHWKILVHQDGARIILLLSVPDHEIEAFNITDIEVNTRKS